MFLTPLCVSRVHQSDSQSLPRYLNSHVTCNYRWTWYFLIVPSLTASPQPMPPLSIPAKLSDQAFM